jgi:TonB family protein
LLRATVEPTARDMRGRTIEDDIAQWVFSQQSRRGIDNYRRLANKNESEAERAAYDSAVELFNAEVAGAWQVRAYWSTQLPAAFWRRYWQAFFEANGIPVPASEPRLLAAEAPILAALETGDFARANSLAPALNAALRDSLADATSRLNRERKTAKFQFAPRKSPCGKPVPPAPRQKRARFVDGESVESFYPQAALKRHEEGSTVLRMRIDRSGCATAVAIVVHSGIRELDAAAVQWFEAARFSPATPASEPIESELVMKVQFKLE